MKLVYILIIYTTLSLTMYTLVLIPCGYSSQILLLYVGPTHCFVCKVNERSSLEYFIYYCIVLVGFLMQVDLSMIHSPPFPLPLYILSVARFQDQVLSIGAFAGNPNELSPVESRFLDEGNAETRHDKHPWQYIKCSLGVVWINLGEPDLRSNPPCGHHECCCCLGETPPPPLRNFSSLYYLTAAY